MAFQLSQEDKVAICRRYEKRYQVHGYHPRTLDWDKGKQNLRFSVLLSQFDLDNPDILDIGCGFGDLNRILQAKTSGSYRYYGIDLVPPIIAEARKRFGNDRVHFVCGDFLSKDAPAADLAIASGIFNLKLDHGDNYRFIERVMNKAFGLCRIGLAFNFLSDRVDYTKENTFHSSPERILAMGYRLSRNIVLLNNYMPFEFSLFVFKDDAFDPRWTVFQHWLDRHPEITL